MTTRLRGTKVPSTCVSVVTSHFRVSGGWPGRLGLPDCRRRIAAGSRANGRLVPRLERLEDLCAVITPVNTTGDLTIRHTSTGSLAKGDGPNAGPSKVLARRAAGLTAGLGVRRVTRRVGVCCAVGVAEVRPLVATCVQVSP